MTEPVKCAICGEPIVWQVGQWWHEETSRDHDAKGPRDISPALDLLDTAYQLARQTVASAPTPQQALEWAAAWYKAAEDNFRKADGMRGETAATIWAAEEFDIGLAEIGEVYERTPQRIHQLIRKAREGE